MRKTIFKMNSDGRIIVHLPNGGEKVCGNLHQAILYSRRK